VAARGADQAGPRDPRHVRAMSADLEKAQASRSSEPYLG
jgi:hypothetical protein